MPTSQELLNALLNAEGFSGALAMMAEAAISGAEEGKGREYAKLVMAIETAQRLADKLEG